MRGRGICFCRWTSRVLGCRLYIAQDMIICGSNIVVDCTGCVSGSCDLTCSCPVETEIKTQRIQDSVCWGNGHFGSYFTTWASVHTYKAFADEMKCFVFAGAIHPGSPSDVCHQRLWTWWRSYHSHGLHTDQGKLWTFYTPIMSWGEGGGVILGLTCLSVHLSGLCAEDNLLNDSTFCNQTRCSWYIVMSQCRAKNWDTLFKIKITVKAYIIKLWLFLIKKVLCILNKWFFCKQIKLDGRAL